MQQDREQMLRHMDVKKLLITLAIPATLAMIVNALYNLVDTIFVAWGAGQIAIGALTIAYPIQMIIIAIGLMIGIGSSSIFSRAFGRGDREAMARAVNSALFMGAVLSISISGLGIIFIDDLLNLFGATESNIGYAKDYMFYILIGLIPFSLSIILNNLSRAEGRAKVAMISMIIGAGVNIILDPIFIFDFGFGLGVSGAAMATVIAKTASFIYVLKACLSPDSNLNIRLKTLHKLDFKMMGEITVIGVPTLARNSLGALMIIVINNLINHYAVGDPAIYVSIFGVINRMNMFLLMPGFGLVQGLQPIVGYNYGGKLHRRLYDVIAYAVKLLSLYLIGAFLLTQLSANLLFMAFSREQDPEFIRYGAYALRMVSIGYLMLGFQILLSSVYQAIGYPVRALIVALSRQFILFIPFAFLFTSIFQIDGIWYAFIAADVISGSLSYLAYRFEMKELSMRISTDYQDITFLTH